MGMTLTKEFVNSSRKVGVLLDFLCQAIDQVDEKDKEIAELKEQYKDMDVTHTVHIAKMNAKIDQLEEDVAWNKYKRCLTMASKCRLRARWFGDNAFYKKEQWALQWHRRWLELADKFKVEAK